MMNKAEFRIGGTPQEEPQKKDAPSPSVPDVDHKPDHNTSLPLTVEEKVIAAMREVYDPEIPVNIYDLGLIYGIEIDSNHHVEVKMTLTSPACPVAESLPGEVRARVSRVIEVTDCNVELVWDPPWSPEKMTDVAKLKLGML